MRGDKLIEVRACTLDNIGCLFSLQQREDTKMEPRTYVKCAIDEP
jgi:hypothetical protein